MQPVSRIRPPRAGGLRITVSKLDRFWTLVMVLLIAVTIGGGLVAWARYQPSPPLEISLPQEEESQGDILIGGAVNNPGYYPFSDSDSITSLIQAAGGTTESADPAGLQLYIPETGATGEEDRSQKVNINRAEAWLLDALPQIGPARAQAIIDYRQENGPFRSIDEITNVEGIGPATYEQIKDLITVADQ
ncbi:MAG: helix-hairpin-helix domain-containing protein [Dehalococcoidales bacterium]|nr:MAG: helix-hairpin-helix domain-containing protein [Dehalococcoidales bacterium]